MTNGYDDIDYLQAMKTDIKIIRRKNLTKYQHPILWQSPNDTSR